MAKILSINNNADFYYEKGMAKSEEFDYVSAIDNFYQALDREGGNIWIMSEIAAAYFELGLTEMSLKLYFKIMALDKKSDIGYLGVTQCLMKQNLISEAIYYINRGLENGAIPEDFEPEEFIEQPALRILKKDDNSDLIALAHKLLAGGEIAYAKQLLCDITKSSLQYGEARSLLAVIAITENDAKTALDYSLETLEIKGEDSGALSTAVMAYNMLGDSEGKAEIIKRIQDADFTDENDLSKIIACFQQLQNDKLIIKYLKKLLNFVPYDYSSLLLLSQAEYNIGNRTKAKQYSVTLRKLYREDKTAAYYARLIDKGEIKRIELNEDLDLKEKNRRIFIIQELLISAKTATKAAAFMEADSDLYEAVLWLFQSHEYELMSRLGSFLCKSPVWQPFIRDLLIEPGLHYRVKKDLLLQYLYHSSDKKFSLLIADIMRFFNPRVPSGGTKVTEGAYYTVYTTLSFIDTEFDRKLNSAYKKLLAAYTQCEFAKLYADVNTLAAILAYMSKVNKVFSTKTDCAEIFGIDKNAFNTYYDALTQNSNKETEKND